MATEVGDRRLTRPCRHVLEHLNRHDEIVAGGKLVGDRSVPAERLDRSVDVGDRVRGQVDPFGVDTPIAQRFDQEAERAAGIEHAPGLNAADQVIGDGAEEARPVLVTLVRRAAAVREVPGVERCVADGRTNH